MQNRSTVSWIGRLKMHQGDPSKTMQRSGCQFVSEKKLLKNHNINTESKIKLRKARRMASQHTVWMWEIGSKRKQTTCILKWKDKGKSSVFRGLKTTNDWVLEKAGLKQQLLGAGKSKKLSFFGHALRKSALYLVKGSHSRNKTEKEKTSEEEDRERHGWIMLTV